MSCSWCFGRSTSCTRPRAATWSTGLLAAAVLAAVLYVVLFEIVGPLSATFFAGTILGIYGQVVVEVTLLVAFFMESSSHSRGHHACRPGRDRNSRAVRAARPNGGVRIATA